LLGTHTLAVQSFPVFFTLTFIGDALSILGGKAGVGIGHVETAADRIPDLQAVDWPLQTDTGLDRTIMKETVPIRCTVFVQPAVFRLVTQPHIVHTHPEQGGVTTIHVGLAVAAAHGSIHVMTVRGAGTTNPCLCGTVPKEAVGIGITALVTPAIFRRSGAFPQVVDGDAGCRRLTGVGVGLVITTADRIPVIGTIFRSFSADTWQKITLLCQAVGILCATIEFEALISVTDSQVIDTYPGDRGITIIGVGYTVATANRRPIVRAEGRVEGTLAILGVAAFELTIQMLAALLVGLARAIQSTGTGHARWDQGLVCIHSSRYGQQDEQAD
jgi:hypothetical protein